MIQVKTFFGRYLTALLFIGSLYRVKSIEQKSPPCNQHTEATNELGMRGGSKIHCRTPCSGRGYTVPHSEAANNRFQSKSSLSKRSLQGKLEVSACACVCHPGYFGHNCEKNLCDDVLHGCSGHGVCSMDMFNNPNQKNQRCALNTFLMELVLKKQKEPSNRNLGCKCSGKWSGFKCDTLSCSDDCGCTGNDDDCDKEATFTYQGCPTTLEGSTCSGHGVCLEGTMGKKNVCKCVGFTENLKPLFGGASCSREMFVTEWH